MLRRSLLIALIATGCAPTGTRDEQTPTPQSANPTSVAPGNPLLAIGNWSAPVSGWSQWLAVYEDGLLELRWFEPVWQPDNPFAEELRVRLLRVPPAELEPLRASLAHRTFETAERHYYQPGVLDGGSLIIADMATHHRRVIVINQPSKLPTPVAAAQSALDRLAKSVQESGQDGFAAGPDRIQLLYLFARGEENRALTVYESGRIELRTEFTTDSEAHEAADYPTPRSVTGQLGPEDLEDLRASLSALLAKPPAAAAAGTTDVLFVGSASSAYRITPQPPPNMLDALAGLEAVIGALDSR